MSGPTDLRPGCPRCRIPLPGLRAGANRCPVCARDFEAALFSPPRLRTFVRRVAESGPVEAAACAVHEANAAVAACDRCGTFTCDLCRIVEPGRTLCAPCFERGLADEMGAETATRVRNYQGLADLCALAGFFGCIYVGAILGPVAAWLALKGRRQSLALGEDPGRWWFTFALGLLEAVGQVGLIGMIVFGLMSEVAS